MLKDRDYDVTPHIIAHLYPQIHQGSAKECEVDMVGEECEVNMVVEEWEVKTLVVVSSVTRSGDIWW